MSTEFGLFNDDGLVEGDFYTTEDARKALDERYSEEDGLEIEEICPDHPDQPRYGCEAETDTEEEE